jgi:hypothetical protein
VFPYGVWLSAERVADKVNALLVIIIMTIGMAISTIAIGGTTILRNTICYTLVSYNPN